MQGVKKRAHSPSNSGDADRACSSRKHEIPFKTNKEKLHPCRGAKGRSNQPLKNFTDLAAHVTDGVSSCSLQLVVSGDRGTKPGSKHITQQLKFLESRAISTERPQEPSVLVAGTALDDGLLLVDLNFKCFARYLSRENFSWCRASSEDQNSGLLRFARSEDALASNRISYANEADVSSSVFGSDFCCAINSWVHPESTIPVHLVAALADADKKQTGGSFWSQRVQRWEDSYESLYSLYESGSSNIFYVHTQSHVVLFLRSHKRSSPAGTCCAVISKSSRGLRATLQAKDVAFVMPLAESGGPATIQEDVLDLIEFGKTHPGQIRYSEGSRTLDNRPESLLLITGVHEVDKFHSFLSCQRNQFSPNGSDVPVLYSPMPFKNASLHTPEVECREARQPMSSAAWPSSQSTEAMSGRSFILEVNGRGALLPPWVISRLSELFKQTQGGSFEAFFAADGQSGLFNTAIGADMDEIRWTPGGKSMPLAAGGKGSGEGNGAARLGPNVIHQIACSDHEYSIKLKSC